MYYSEKATLLTLLKQVKIKYAELSEGHMETDYLCFEVPIINKRYLKIPVKIITKLVKVRLIKHC